VAHYKLDLQKSVLLTAHGLALGFANYNDTPEIIAIPRGFIIWQARRAEVRTRFACWGNISPRPPDRLALRGQLRGKPLFT